MRVLMWWVIILFVGTGSAHAEDRLRLRDYVPVVAAGAFDVTSTVTSPGRETNPAIRWIRHEPTMLTVGSAMEVSAFLVAHQTIGKRHPKLVRAAILTATAIHVFAAVNNLQNPRRSDGRPR